MAVQAGTVLGEAGEARWDTIQLQRGDMLLMVATSRHHGLPALPDSKDGLQGTLFNLWTPNRAHRHHQPNTRHLDPTPPNEALAVAGDLSSWDLPSVDQVLWVGKGAVGRLGFSDGDATQALFADTPESNPAGPPTCPFHPTFLSRSAPAFDLAVIEVGEQCMLFFVGSVHQLEVCKGDSADAESEIHFAMSGVAPPGRPTTLWHLANTAPTWRSPKCSKAGAWAITCPCECKVCLLVCLLHLLHGGVVSSVRVRDSPPPPPCPPGPLSYQGSIAIGHTYGGAEGARKFFFIPLAYVASLPAQAVEHPNAILEPNLDPNAHPNPQPAPNPTPNPTHDPNPNQD